MKTLLVALLLAAPTAPAVRAEIDQLLGRLESSGCRFNRNGSWHPAAEAKSHLLRKLEYFDDRSGVASTEQFIALVASRSSVSGKAAQLMTTIGFPDRRLARCSARATSSFPVPLSP